MTYDHMAVLETRCGALVTFASDAELAQKNDVERAPSNVLRMIMLIVLYAIPAFVLARPVTDNDLWMNLRAGRWIAENGTVPTSDAFTAFNRGTLWVSYSWLFQVLIHNAFLRFGLFGAVLYRAGLSLLVLVAIHRLVAVRERRFVVATGLAALAFVALIPLLNERSWLFTLLFTTLTLDTILALREGRPYRFGWLLPFLYVIWANVHIQFIYGLIVLGMACAAPVVDRYLGSQAGERNASVAGTRAWWRLLALTFACVTATLVNPYHARIYRVVLDYASQAETYNLVVELLASSFRLPWEWAMPALVGLAAFLLGRRRGWSVFEGALLVLAAVLALRARRDVWFAVLAALAVITAGDREPADVCEQFAFTRIRRAILALTSIAMLALLTWQRGLCSARLDDDVAAHYPARAAAAVERVGARGPLFSEYGWGSYLIWRLPDLPVTIDGRADLHGPERIRRNVDTISGVKDWDTDADLMRANTVIVRGNAAIASLLRRDARFELVHEDAVAVAFVARASTDGKTVQESPIDAAHRYTGAGGSP